MTFSELREIVRHIRDTVSCPNCKSGFSSQDIHVVGTFFNEAVFHLFCPECTANALLSVVLSRGRLKVTRKHMSIRRLASNGKSITMDDILDMQNALKNFDGDFKTLL